MRTMVVLEDQLHRQAKAYAAAHGLSLARLVDEALRQRLHPIRTRPGGRLPPLPVCHAGGGLRPGISLDDLKTVQAALDEGTPRDRLR